MQIEEMILDGMGFGFSGGAPAPIVISLTSTEILVVGDDTKWYSKDSSHTLFMPSIATLISGWHIHVTATAPGNGSSISIDFPGDIGVRFSVGGIDYTYALVLTGAAGIITYNGTKWIVTGTGIVGSND